MKIVLDLKVVMDTNVFVSGVFSPHLRSVQVLAVRLTRY